MVTVNEKFKKAVGSDADADTMERELERVAAYVPFSRCDCFVLIGFLAAAKLSRTTRN